MCVTIYGLPIPRPKGRQFTAEGQSHRDDGKDEPLKPSLSDLDRALAETNPLFNP